MTNMAALTLIFGMEDKSRKIKIIVIAAIVGVFALIMGALHLSRFASTQRAQSLATEYGEKYDKEWASKPENDYNIYDAGCIKAASTGQTNDDETSTIAQADKVSAALYLITIGLDCAAAGVEAQAGACLTHHNWSTIYILNGILLLCIMLNMVCVAIGAYKPMLRMIGAWCGNCLCCIQLIFVILTAAWRFSAWGNLCAMTNYTTVNPCGSIECVAEVTADYVAEYGTDYKAMNDAIKEDAEVWTYQKDGSLITGIWVVQLLCCCCMCCAATWPLRPSMPQ